MSDNDTMATPSTFWCNLIERFIKSGEGLKETTEKNNVELVKTLNSLKESVDNLNNSIKNKPCLLEKQEEELDKCKNCLIERYSKNYDLLLKVVIALATGFVGYEFLTKFFLK